MRHLTIVGLGFVSFLGLLSLGNESCTSNNSASAPVTVTQGVTLIATPPPSTVAGRDWNFSIMAAAFPARYLHETLVFNNALWIIGGNLVSGIANDVWTSTDGKNWTNVLSNNPSPGPNQFSPREYSGSAVLNGKMWIVGGFDGSSLNDVWSSTDGVSWTNVLANNASPGPNQFPQRRLHNVIAYNGKLYVIGGLTPLGTSNDVWSSSDGVSWTQNLAYSASPGPNQFPSRTYARVAVYNNALWFTGGIGPSNYFNDVWTSSDGTTWINALTDNASPGPNQYSRRAAPGFLVYGNAMWIIGGQPNGAADLNDVWYSTNGSFWSQMTASAAFSGRTAGGAVVLNNAMWLLGGFNGSRLNDVWYSPF